MHSTLNYEVAKARIADLHHHAAQERMARAAVRASRAQPHHRIRAVPGHDVSGLARWALTPSSGRSPSPAR